MTLLEDFRWALVRVTHDWRRRKPKQMRDVLPASYTTSIMRYIRINACKHSAPDSIECAKWSQNCLFPINSEIPTYPLGMDEELKGPFLKTQEHVCGGCRHTRVTNEQLIAKLGLDHEIETFSARTLQRYLNDGDPMPVDQFRRAVCNALAEGWLGLWQSVSIITQINEMLASQRGIRAVIRRAMERKAYIDSGKLTVTEVQLYQELQKQLRIIDNENTRIMDRRLQDRNLDPEMREMIKETLSRPYGKG